MTSCHSRQSGFTLFTTLVMLVLVTLLVLSTFNVTDSNIKVVTNMQRQSEADASAIEAANRVVASTNFFTNPSTVSATPLTTDVNGDSNADYTVAIAATCARAANIPISSLNSSLADDVPCFGSSASQNTGIVVAGGTSNSGRSACANTEWDISATATDTALGSGVSSNVHQGVRVRIAQYDVDNNPNCN